MRQDDYRLRSSGRPFAANGCAIMSCFFWANQITGQVLSPEYVIDKVDEWLIKRWVTSELYVLNWGRILTDLGVKCQYLGHKPAGIPCLPNEFEILKVTFGNYGHFLPGDGNGHFVFDPLGRNPRQSKYNLHSKRVFKLENA